MKVKDYIQFALLTAILGNVTKNSILSLIDWVIAIILLLLGLITLIWVRNENNIRISF